MSIEIKIRKNEPIDRAIRRMKKKLERENIIKGVRAKRYFEKPCEKRCRKEKVQAFTQMLRRRYEPVFEGPASNGVNFGYSGVEISVAEAGAFGRLSDVRRANIHDILLWAMKRELESRKQTSNP